MKELEKSRYFDSVLAGTHMLIESMDVRELHSAFKVVSDLQQKIVVLIARIAQTEANKLHSPGSSNLSLRPNTSMPRKDQTTPIISSVNTSRLSLDSRKTSPREAELAAKKRAYAPGALANGGNGMLWAMNTFLLPSPDTTVAPDTDLSSELTRQGLGLTVSSTADRRSLVNTAWNPDELIAHICRRYPRVPSLARVGFTYCYRPSGNQRHLISIQSKLPYDLYSLLGNEGILFLKPKAVLKPMPLRPGGGPQETICIDDDDDDSGQPTPISTGRRQQPGGPPVAATGAAGASQSPGSSMGHHPMRMIGPGSRTTSPLHQMPPGPSHHMNTPLRPPVSMPPPQMVPAVRAGAPTGSAIPLPPMTSVQQAPSRGPLTITLPVPPSTGTPSSYMGPGGIPSVSGTKDAANPALSSVVASVPMHVSLGPQHGPSQHGPPQHGPPPHGPPQHGPPQLGPHVPPPQGPPQLGPPTHGPPPVTRAQVMEVLKLPVEGPPASSAASAPSIASVTPATTAAAVAVAAADKGLGGATARGEPPEKRQALNAVPNAAAPPPPPPSSSEPEGDVLQQIRTCMKPEGERARRSLIRCAMELQGLFFSCRSFLRALLPGAKRQLLTDVDALNAVAQLMRHMAAEELGTMHTDVGAKNARDNGFIKTWPLSADSLKRYGISESKLGAALLKPAQYVQSTVERDLSTLVAATDWAKRKEKLIEHLRREEAGGDKRPRNGTLRPNFTNGGLNGGAAS